MSTLNELEWHPISKQRYIDLLRANLPMLTCYASCNDMDYVMTEWGLKDRDLPFIKAVDNLRYDEGPDEHWIYEYFEYKPQTITV